MHNTLALFITFLLGFFIIIGVIIAFFLKKQKKVLDFIFAFALSILTMLILTDLLGHTIEHLGIKHIYLFILFTCLGLLIFKIIDDFVPEHEDADEHIEAGCCHHEIMKGRKRDLLIHPVKHTIHTFAFILVITLILNYFINVDVISSFYSNDMTAYKILQPVITAIVGLIPNCAVSIAITLMLIKGTISFGAAMAGLMSNAGLGLLVLLRMNNIKDTIKTILILLVISIISGIILQFAV